MEKQTLFFQD